MSQIDINSGNHASKAKRTREKIALVIFLAIVALGIYVITWYFSTATAYNMAAAAVDETAGTMGSYCTLVYSGTVPKEDDPSTSSGTVFADEPSTGSGQRSGTLEAKVPVYVSDVRDKYFEKDASVITISLSKLAAEKEPSVLIANNKRIGVFSIQAWTGKSKMHEIVQGLWDEGVDVVVCICPRTTMISSYDGLSAVICTAEKSPSETSEGYVNGTFIARSPEVGSVGAISISESNVFTQTIYDSLD